MRDTEYDHTVQKSELSAVGEREYLQAFLDKYEDRFHNEERNYCEHVRYRLPLAFGVDITLEQVAEMTFSDNQSNEIITKIMTIVSSVNTIRDDDWR